MNKKNIIYAFICLCLCLLIFAAMFFYNKIKADINIQGQYSFLSTRKKLKDLSHIKIKTNAQEINLVKRGKLWYFTEANDYFVNNESLANLLNTFNKSILLSKQQKTTSDYKINIQTFDNKDNLLDNIYIHDRINNSDRAVISYPDDNFSYIINSLGSFSAEPQAWIPYPLLSVDFVTIEKITINNKTFNRKQIEYLWQHVISMENFINNLSFIDYTGITTKQDLNQSYPDVHPHRIQIEMIGGLLYIFDVYLLDESYWMTITLAATPTAVADVYSFVEENQKYFSRWIFQLNDEQGELFYTLGYNKK